MSNGDETMKYQLSLEKFVMQGFGLIIAQFTEKTNISFRDALYHLARTTKQHVDVAEDLDGGNAISFGLFLSPAILVHSVINENGLAWLQECGTLFASSAENAMEGDTVTIVSLYMSFLLPLVSIVTLCLFLKFTKLHLPKGSYNGYKGRLLALAGDYTAAADIFHKILVMVSDAKSSMFT
ncbi:hypothetical protein E2542_SST04585 [Spatholobus suberectus]|nr:hypothetical protein E2542_SST04585 [Spatholobus suberectus]